MLNRKLALLVLAPLFSSSLALAQAPDEKGSQPDRPGYEKDAAEWRKDACADMYARAAAHLAYLEAKLNLADQQRDAWSNWRQTQLDAANQRRAACLERQSHEEKRPTALELEARREKILGAVLQHLQASHPALQALYDALNSEQKATFDEAYRRRFHHRWGHWREHGMHGERM